MSIEEKIETLQSIMNDACKLCNDYFGLDPDCDKHCIRLNTINEASAALRKADKYKWHDLRKNPDDLPPEYATVEVVLSTVMIYDIAIYCKDYGFRPWYAGLFQDCPEEWKHKIMAWKEIEPFEVEE